MGLESEEIVIVVQWSPRKEDVEDCAKKTILLMRDLKKISPLFQNWSNMRRTLKQNLATSLVGLDSTSDIRKLLLQGQIRKDAPPRDVVPQLGFGTLLWNRDSGGKFASLNIRCGAYSLGGLNSVEIRVQPELSVCLNIEQLTQTLKLLIEIWSANLGVIYRSKYSEKYGFRRTQLAFYLIPKTDYNRHWKKSGNLSENYMGGELYIDEKVRQKFDSGLFEAPTDQNKQLTMTGRILKRVRVGLNKV
jgi:hypothetical protein